MKLNICKQKSRRNFSSTQIIHCGFLLIILYLSKASCITEKILLNLGIAFQIKDDILGVFGDNKVIGKSTNSDIEEFKQTILYSYIKINKKEYLNDLLKYYGKKNKSKEIQKIFKESGALNYANDRMNEMFNVAKENVCKLNIKENIKNILLGFIKYLEIRKK